MRWFLQQARGEISGLLRHLRMRTGSREDAEDILQDALLALCAQWNLGETVEDVLGWLYCVTSRKVVDYYRRRARAPRPLPLAEADAADLWELADARAGSPEDAALRHELREALAEAVSELPAEQREVFLFTEVDGLSFKEVQARTGVPLNTLLSRKHYAVRKLRTSLARKLSLDEEV
jgi:RNA polymerase sigma factor (sigma-70 family)